MLVAVGSVWERLQSVWKLSKIGWIFIESIIIGISIQMDICYRSSFWATPERLQSLARKMTVHQGKSKIFQTVKKKLLPMTVSRLL